MGYTEVPTDPAVSWRDGDLRCYTGNGGDGATCSIGGIPQFCVEPEDNPQQELTSFSEECYKHMVGLQSSHISRFAVKFKTFGAMKMCYFIFLQLYF